MRHGLLGQRIGNIDACILRHGHEIIGGMAHHRILRVDEADALQPLHSGIHNRLGEW